MMRDAAMPPPVPAIPAPLGVRHVGGHAGYGLLVIGVLSFLTLVDLFAAQAILPTLSKTYGVGPAAIGAAVNASTLGMAVSGLAIAIFGGSIERRRGVWLSLVLLSIPTASLAFAPDLAAFTVLRVAQGVFMAAAFTLTVAFLSEHGTAAETAAALAAYVTGNVASNLVGRIVSAAVADHVGLAGNFFFFALLNLAGAVLALVFLDGMSRRMPASRSEPRGGIAAVARHLADPRLRASFAAGFLILFAFLGIFTYVNFVLVRPPIALGAMSLGLAYLVFLPSLISTPFAGRLVVTMGLRRAIRLAFGVALIGLAALLVPSLPSILGGLALFAAGTFAAQAIVTGSIGRIAMADHAAASGLYLASYYCGGLAGGIVVGVVFDHVGWTAAVLLVALAIGAAMALAARSAEPAAKDGASATSRWLAGRRSR